MATEPVADSAPSMRQLARDLFLQALEESSVQAAFARNVRYEAGALRVCEDLYSLADHDRVSVIAVGKAAHAMTETLAGELGASIGGIVAAPTDPAAQIHGFRYFRGGHPIPNDDSLRAARAMLGLAEQQTEQSLLIYLLSGGGSAVAEKPLDEDISLGDLQETYRALVLSGAPIAEINAIRKHLSAVKGGRLARAAAQAQQVSIMVSDVPDNALDALASGPTMPDSTTVEDCYAIAQRHGMLGRFPESVRRLFQQRALEETPKRDDPAFVRARWWPVLSNATAQSEAAKAAAAAGLAVTLDNSCDDWDYARAGDYLLDRLRRLRRDAERVCLISGGEVTVQVPEESGSGGRNQQFALYCARMIAGENIALLSAGTDGIDGNSPAAGAVCDGTTVNRARAIGLDPDAALARFDAFPLFDKLGDAIITGPTGNNIRDLRILLAY